MSTSESQAAMSQRKQFIRVLILGVMVVLFGSIGYFILFRGQESFLECVYMTVISLTTVGYGEVVEVTGNPAATVYTIILIVLGMGTLVYVAGTFTALIVEGHLSGFLRRKRMQSQINTLKGHTIVCGAGEVGLRVIDELLKNMNDVVIVDVDENRLAAVGELYHSLVTAGSKSGKSFFHIKGDATDDKTLVDAGVNRAGGLVAVLPSDKDNLFITMSARMANADLRIVSKMVDARMEPKLRKAGADSVVSPNSIGGLRIASEMIRPSAVDFLDTMIRSAQGTIRIEEIPIREDSRLKDKTIEKSGLVKSYNVMILALERIKGKGMIFNPDPSEVLSPGMTLVVMGDIANVREARQM